MAADVTIFAALLAGLVSFLSPCVLPLVPPYLVYLAGTSLERLAEAEPAPQVRRDTVMAAAPVRGRVLDSVRRARRKRKRDRRTDTPIFERARHRRRHRHHRHGPALSRAHADRFLAPAGTDRGAKAGRALGRLCDGARLRARLDTVHRADPGGDPGGRGVQGHRRQGRGPARQSTRSGSACRSSSRHWRSSRLRPFWRAFARISPMSSG